MSRGGAREALPREIPGYYYDKVKKKHFKIAHPASGGNYTASSLSKRCKLEKDAEVEATQQRLAHQRSKARKRLALPCIESSLISRSLVSADTRARGRVVCSGFTNIASRSKSLLNTALRTRIAYDAEKSELYLAARCWINVCSVRHAPQECVSPDVESMMALAPLLSPASSLTAHGGLLLGTSVGDLNRPAEVVIKTAQGGRISTVRGTLWCSTIQPDSRYFAAAGSTVLLYDAGHESDERQEIRLAGKTDVMSMDFLDPNILALGCRNGDVSLLDVRARNSVTTPRFRHGGGSGSSIGIAALKSVHSQALLVSGLQNSLSLYDMRFLRQNRALVNFPNHKNEHDMNLNAMAFCDDLLVVAQPEHDLKLWNMNGDFLGSKKTGHQVEDILFPHEAGTEHDTMWTMSRGMLEQWKFADA